VPFVRFARDKRGYEYVYLVHDSTRGGRPSRPAVLYWYRTPPGVKVGRPPFDEEVRQRLEAQNPEIRFDWRAITSAQPPPPDAEHWRERRRAEKATKLARVKEERAETADRDELEAGATSAAEEIAETEEFHDDEPAVVSALEQGGVEAEAVEQNAPTAANELGAEGTAPSATEAPQARSRRRRRGRRRKHRPGGQEGTRTSIQPAPDGAVTASASADQADPEESGESDPQEPGDS
jgi:hypothetical protein